MYTSKLSTKVNNLIEEAKDAQIPYISKPKQPSLFSTYTKSSGLLTLSKFKVDGSSFVNFKYSAGKDAYIYKGILYTKVEVGHRKHLHLFNLHLQNSVVVLDKSKDNIN